MANQRISQFTYTSHLTGDELIGVAINGQNKAISVGQILSEAEHSAQMQNNTEDIAKLNHDLIANELLTRETAEKLTALSGTVNDLYLSVGGIVDGVENKIQEVYDDLSSYTAHIQKNSDLIAHVQSDILRLDKAVGKLGERVVSNTDVINQHTVDIASLHEGLQELSDTALCHISYFAESVTPVIDNIYDRLAAAESHAEANQTQVDELSAYTYTEIAAAHSNYEQLVETVESSYAYIKGCIESVYADLSAYDSSLQSQIDEVVAYSSSNNMLISQLDEKVDNINTTLNDVNNTQNEKLGSLDERLTVLEGTAETQGDGIASLKAELSSVHDELAAVNDEQNTKLSDLDGRLTIVEDTVKTQGEDIVKLQAGLVDTNEAVEENAAAISDINSTISDIKSDITHLQTDIESDIKPTVQKHSAQILTLESHYTTFKNRLDKFEDSVDALSDAVTEASDAIHALETKTDDIISDYKAADEKLENDYKTADQAIIDSFKLADTELKNYIDNAAEKLSEKIIAGDNIVKAHADDITEALKQYLVGIITTVDTNAKTRDNALQAEYKSITSALLERIKKDEEIISDHDDSINHIAYHESHPETSVWGEFGIISSCGYSKKPCYN